MIRQPYKTIVGAALLATALWGVYSHGHGSRTNASSLAIQPLLGWAASEAAPLEFDDALSKPKQAYGMEMKTVLVSKNRQAVAAVFVRSLNVSGEGSASQVVEALAQSSGLNTCAIASPSAVSGFSGCMTTADDAHRDVTMLIVPDTMDRYFMIVIVSHDQQIDPSVTAKDIFRRAHIVNE